MLWVYDYKYLNSYSAGIDFKRRDLTSADCPRAVRVNHMIFFIARVDYVNQLSLQSDISLLHCF